jgi:hypothetical protein
MATTTSTTTTSALSATATGTSGIISDNLLGLLFMGIGILSALFGESALPALLGGNFLGGGGTGGLLFRR